MIVTSCHPGVVTSSVLRNLGFGSGWNSAEQGAALPLQLAVGPKEPASGTFWSGPSSGSICSFGQRAAERSALWQACEAMAEARNANS